MNYIRTKLLGPYLHQQVDGPTKPRTIELQHETVEALTGAKGSARVHYPKDIGFELGGMSQGSVPLAIKEPGREGTTECVAVPHDEGRLIFHKDVNKGLVKGPFTVP